MNKIKLTLEEKLALGACLETIKQIQAAYKGEAFSPNLNYLNGKLEGLSYAFCFAANKGLHARRLLRLKHRPENRLDILSLKESVIH